MNLDIVWSDSTGRGDWQVLPSGRLSTGHLLVTAVLISIFTDRVAPPDHVFDDGTTDPRGWHWDSLDGQQIGSWLWLLRRVKIADRNQLIARATDMLQDCLQWMITAGIAAAVNVAVQSLPASINSSGSLLQFVVTLVQPSGGTTTVRALWSAA